MKSEVAQAQTLVLTGATGFVGSHLLHGLLHAGFRVVVLKRSASNTRRITDVLGKVTTIDIDRTPASAAFQGAAVDAVVHVATAYGRQGERLSEVVDANVAFPLRLLEAATAAGVRCFINTDTFTARAPTPPHGLEPYAVSKQHFRIYGEMHAVRHDTQFLNLQLEHAYGPDDNERKFVPLLLRALVDGAPTFDLTPGDQRRDFVYVDDVVSAFLRVLACRAKLPGKASTIQVGTGTSDTLAAFARLARELSGSRTELRFGAIPYRGGESMDPRADLTTLRELGWSPSIDAREGLRRTIAAMRG